MEIYINMLFLQVVMANPFLNKELDDYLSKRRKSEEIVVIKKEKKKPVKEVAVEEAEEEIIDEGRTIKKPWYVKIFPFLYKKREEEAELIEEDIKEVDEKEEKTKEFLKNIYYWLTKLPPQEVKRFKASSDYELYKEVLGMYGLIKNQEE